MIELRLLGILAVAFIISGCAPLSPLTFSVPNVGIAKKKLDAELRSMTVTVARADERTGELLAGMETEVPGIWQTALTEAINKMAIFQDDATTKVNLSVKILKFAPPGLGAGMTTETTARYQIIDRRTGSIIFSKDISAAGTTPWDYAFIGMTRERESINRSVKNNISQFLQALESIEINKSALPAKSEV